MKSGAYIGKGMYTLPPPKKSCDSTRNCHCILCLTGFSIINQHIYFNIVKTHEDIFYYIQCYRQTMRLPLQVHERGTIYRQPSAPHQNRSLPSKKNLNRFFFDFHFVCGNVNIDGATENAGVENAIRSKMQGWKIQEWKKLGADRRGGKCKSI